MSALANAFAESQRSLLSCKSAVASSPAETLLAAGPSGIGYTRNDSNRAANQYRHFKNWAAAAIRVIAERLAAQPIRVGRVKAGTKLGTKDASDVEPLKTHPVLDAFANPNPLMTSWHLLYTL